MGPPANPTPERDMRLHRLARGLCPVGAVLALLAASPARAAGEEQRAQALAQPELVEQGRRLYAEGVRADGTPLVAERLGVAPLKGRAAACVACHKRAGMGGIEGDVIVPPINGPSLYAGPLLRDRVVIAMDPRRGRAFNPSHPPYDAPTLMAAIRDGIHVTGRQMHALMPRYHINEDDLLALKAYMDQLSTRWSPGVTDKAARFATVIAPDVDPARKDAFLRSLKALFDQKNSNTLPGHRHMVSASEGMLNLERNWELSVWQLQGPPGTWEAQLQAFYDEAPVFAIVSGLGDGEWSPVQEFCEHARIPCWFPSVVNPPPGAEGQTYTLYFSDGVTLEAKVLGAYLGQAEAVTRPTRVVEVLRDEPAARAAAKAFAQARPAKLALQERVIGSRGIATLADALRGLEPGDALVLWLRRADLASLVASEPPRAMRIYTSTFLAGQAPDIFPAAWRRSVHLIYPYELPEKRLYNMATFHSWIELRGLPLVDEAMQSEVFFSVGYLMYTMSEMLDNVYRDCLIDRGETMVRRRELLRAEEETMVRQGGHPPPRSTAARSTYAPGAVFGTDPNGKLAQKNTPLLGVREGTTIYPRLALATGQRFASKGAYLVHFSGAHGPEITPESDWIVP